MSGLVGLCSSRTRHVARAISFRLGFGLAVCLAWLALASGAAQAQSLTLSADRTTFDAAGDTIDFTYTFDAGSFAVDQLTVTSLLLGLSVSCPPLNEEVGEIVMCTASYTVTAADLQAGFVNERASYSATSTPAGTPLSGSSNQVTVPYSGATTTVVSSNNNPSTLGESVTFTATVSAVGGLTPTGTVTFNVDGVEDTVALVGGTASISTSALAVGDHTITAAYNNESPFNPSSGMLTQTVNKGPTTTTLTASPNPSVFGQPVTFTAAVSATFGTPTGTVTFRDGSTVLDTVPLSAGTVSLPAIASLAVGSHTITATYNGNDDYLSSMDSVTQQVNAGATETSVAATPNPSVFGQSVTFTATVAATAPASGTPTGTVTFKDGSTVLDTVPLSGGTASVSTSTLAVGNRTITATYDGSAEFLTSMDSVTQEVDKGETATTLAAAPNPSVFGQSVTFTATVAATAPAVGTPTGTVTFRNGSTVLDTVPLSGGTASFSTSTLAVGNHRVSARYDGSADFKRSTSPRMAQKVNKGETTTALAAAPNPSVFGQSVTLTATVAVTAPAAGTPTGAVTFRDGSTKLGTVALSGGTASLSTSSLAVGSHSVTARYDGGTDFKTSTSSAVSQEVRMGATDTTIAVTPNPSVSGQSVTFTATVAVTAPAGGTPTGMVTFRDGNTVLGTVTLSGDKVSSGGTASLSVSSLDVGNHRVTARYEGSTDFKRSTSSTVTQRVKKGATQTAIAVTRGNVTPGQPLRFTATVAAMAPASGTPTGTVVFKQGSTTLGSAELSDGRASLSTTALPTGRHRVSARYTGAESWIGSRSAAVVVTVDPRVGPEFRINSFTAGSQQQPSVAGLAGGFVVAWESDRQDGSGYGIYGQRFTTGGKRVDREFRINTELINDQMKPSVAELRNGGFFVAWQSEGGGFVAPSIAGQLFDGAGARVGGEIRVSTDTSHAPSMPSAAGLKSGGHVVVWESDGQDGSGLGIYGQRFRANGNPVGSEFRVNARQAGDQAMPAVAGLDDGGFVVLWASEGQDGSGLGIYGQRFNASGEPVGSEFRVNSRRAGDQSMPSVAGLNGGGFVAAWASDGQDGSGYGIFAQRFDATGKASGNEFRVNTTRGRDQWQPAAVAAADGGFFVAWTSSGQDGSGSGVYGQRFDARGNAVDIEVQVNTTTRRDQWQPSVANLGNGDLVVAWTSKGQDGSREGIYGQRLRIIDAAAATDAVAASTPSE